MPCRHYNALIAYKLTSNGRAFYRLQCPECGAPIGQRLREDEKDDLLGKGVKQSFWNDKAALEYSLKWNRLSAPIFDQINLERRLAWWANYKIYLQSAEWKNRSAETLQRAKYICQSCHKAKATQVHHLSYERAGHEAWEDLQALCFDCHDTAHDGILTALRMLDETAPLTADE